MGIPIGIGIGVPWGGSTKSGAGRLLAKLGDTYGLAIDFATDQSIVINDSTTPANNYTSSGTVVNGALVGPGSVLTYSAPSPKMTLQSTGYYAYRAYNLLPQSSDFTNAVWAKGRVTVTANSTTDPFGGSTGTLVTIDNTTNSHGIASAAINSISALTPYVASIYVKYNSSQRYVTLYMGFASGDYIAATYDLLTMTNTQTAAGTIGTFISQSITAVGGGWYRLMVVGQNTSTSMGYGFAFSSSGTPVFGNFVNESYTGNGTNNCFAYGPQLSKYPCVTDYIATGASAVYSLPYEWTTSAVCQGVLIEQAATNLLTYSNTFSNATWTATNLTNVTTTTTGPDGVTTSATQLNETVTNAAHSLTQSVTKAASAIAYYASVFAKVGTGRTRIAMQLDDGAGNTLAYAFDVSGGLISSATTAGTPFTSDTATITSVGNGWYRCTIGATSNTATTINVTLLSDNGSGAGAVSTSFAGTAANGCYVYQAQLEVFTTAPSATSPIITGSATVTRVVTAITLACTSFPYNQPTGSIYVMWNATIIGSQRLLELSNGPAARVVDMATSASKFTFFNGTSTMTSGANVNSGAVNKGAGAYATTDYASVLNGGTAAAAATVTVNTAVTLYFGTSSSFALPLNGYLQQMLYLPRRATNAQLITLST